MPSRKKDRGKQRKARQKMLANDKRDLLETLQGLHDLDNPTPAAAKLMGELKSKGCRFDKHEDGSTLIAHPCWGTGAEPGDLAKRDHLDDAGKLSIAQNYVHNYARGLREGDFHGTEVIAENLEDHCHITPQLADELLKADIHLSMLHFLNQSDRSVSEVLGRRLDAGESIKLPFYWVNILGMLPQEESGIPGCSDAVLLTLARGIEPFVASVIDGKRELFRSNHVWHLCLSPFFDLVRCIMMSKEGFLTMISYEGFLSFVAQASCWSQSREDIVAERRIYRGGSTVPPISAAQRVFCLVYKDETKRALDQIARTPLVADCTKCNDSTVVGLVRMLNANVHYSAFERGTDLLRWIIDSLILKHGYVDKWVIAELIEYGRNNSSKEAAEFVLSLMVAILGRCNDYGHIEMIDSRYAAAVRHGLLEFSIDALVAHGNESGCDIAEWLYCISYGLCLIAMHSKTSRALREKQVQIMMSLDHLRKVSVSQSNEICSLIDDAVEASSCATCCNCLKQCDRKELLFCKRCGVECYCSADCQSESYTLGHDKVCKEEVQVMAYLRAEGLSETELKRWLVLGSNLMMNGCRLVRKKAASFLDEESNVAEVMIDFRESPPDVVVSRSDEGESSGSVKFIFTAPVYYGFAEKADVEANVVLEKFVSRRSLAQQASSVLSDDDAD